MIPTEILSRTVRYAELMQFSLVPRKRLLSALIRTSLRPSVDPDIAIMESSRHNPSFSFIPVMLSTYHGRFNSPSHPQTLNIALVTPDWPWSQVPR